MLLRQLRELLDPGKLSLRAFNKLGPEDTLSVHVAGDLREWSLTGRLDGVWFHVANEVAGGTENAALRYAIAKNMGLVPGTPDFAFLGKSGCVLIELKSKTGTQTEPQKNFQAWCENQDVPYYLCRSREKVEAALIKEGLLS